MREGVNKKWEFQGSARQAQRSAERRPVLSADRAFWPSACLPPASQSSFQSILCQRERSLRPSRSHPCVHDVMHSCNCLCCSDIMIILNENLVACCCFAAASGLAKTRCSFVRLRTKIVNIHRLIASDEFFQSPKLIEAALQLFCVYIYLIVTHMYSSPRE